MADRSTSRAELDRPLAKRIGARLRLARTRAGLTQQALAGDRYTKAYVSALENGLVKPSMAALNYLADRLGIPPTALIEDPSHRWTRLDADLRLAAGDWHAAIDAYETLLASGPPSAERAEILRGMAEASARLERPEQVLATAAEAADLFDGLARPLDAAWARYWLAYGLHLLEQGEDARRLLQRIEDDLASGHIPDSPDLRVRAAIALSIIEAHEENPERALASLEAARAHADELDERRRAVFYQSLAMNYFEVGDLEGALTAGTQALAHYRSMEAETESLVLENSLALVYLELGNVERARAHASSAHAGLARLGNERQLAHVMDTRARVELAAGDPVGALALADEAIDGARIAANGKAMISALLTRARALRALDRLDEAVATLDEAALIARERGRRPQLQQVLADLADTVAQTGDLARAFAISQEAVRANRVAPTTAGTTPTRSAAGR